MNIDDYFPASLTKPHALTVKRIKSNLESWFSIDKYMALRARLLAIEFLRLLKRRVSYKHLSEITGVSQSVLCRYVRGSIVPSFSQSINILASLASAIDINSIIKRFLGKEQSIVIDLSRLLKDPYLVKIIAFILLAELAGKKIDKIVVGSPTVLPIATIISLELGSDIVLVKRRKYPNVSYYEEVIVRSMKDVETLYVDKDMISRRDNIVIITDLVITGRTLRALLNIAARARAVVTDVIAIVAIGTEWRKRVGKNIVYLSHIEKPMF